jgi:hypothetical protein
MERAVVKELHYITPAENLASIVRYGLVCHNLAERVPHASVASNVIQDRRLGKRVPTRLLLHEYANLYFDARNPMMSYLHYNGSAPIVVLRISPEVLDIPDTVIADGNAACDHTRFYPSPGGIVHLDQALVYATWWTDPDPFVKAEKKRIRCAEVLVPARIPVEYIEGALVSKVGDISTCTDVGISGEVNANVFFK